MSLQSENSEAASNGDGGEAENRLCFSLASRCCEPDRDSELGLMRLRSCMFGALLVFFEGAIVMVVRLMTAATTEVEKVR